MPKVKLVYDYVGQNIKSDVDIFDSIDKAFDSAEWQLKQDFVKDIKFTKKQAPCAESLVSLRQCVWRDFFGFEGRYQLNELKKQLKNYLPKMSIPGFPEKTEKLENIRQEQIRKVFKILSIA